MPTMQEELSRTLKEWEVNNGGLMQAKQNLFNVTNNVTRATFDYVKANPGVTATQAAKAMEPQGFKASSVSSLMAAMVRNGLCRKEGYKYFVTAEEYVPLKPTRKLRKMKKTEVKVDIKELNDLTITRPEPKPQLVISADYIINNLPIREAFALFKELEVYFGSSK
jgi:hypothetical protein